MMPFASAIFLSATLLFLVQPITGRRFLPLLGGSPAAWTACMLFFQTALLAGYAYAHGLAARWSVRRQAAAHAVVLALPFAAFLLGRLPGDPPVAGSPVPWVLLALSCTVGLPFFAVSTTAPLLQRWFSRTAHAGASDPYFLYAASNAGSLAAVLAYPVLMEPLLGLGAQEAAWRAGYGAFFLVALGCALRAGRAVETALPEAASAEGPAPAWPRRLRWIALSAVPSSLLLGSTAHLSTNISPFPLLWVLPLGVYLLSFILVFSRRPLLPHDLALSLQPLLVGGLAMVFFWEAGELDHTFTLVVPLHLAAFFMTAMACHGELAADRPSSRHLTDFYLAMAVGGALGGVFNAVVAPAVFSTIAEYPLMLVAACILRPRGKGEKALDGPWGNVLPLAAGVSVLVVGQLLVKHEEKIPRVHEVRALFVAVPAAILSVVAMRSPVRIALCVAAALAGGWWYGQRGLPVLHRDRSFFGAHHVEETRFAPHFRYLVNGHILHGTQNTDQPGEPLSYYHRTGPCGQVFEAFGPTFARGRVGAVGLGAGTVAAYARPGQRWTFFEIDPAVERTARRYFTYLADSKGDVDVRLGDGRLSLARAADGEFDLLLFDAFSSDAIPAHLLTREAIRLYLAKLAPRGVLAFHISCRFVDLRPVLSSIARDEGLAAKVQEEAALGVEESSQGKSDSTWVVLARTPEHLEPLAALPPWTDLEPATGFRSWTDDFAPLLSVLKGPWRK
jgi:hypothetical protein